MVIGHGDIASAIQDREDRVFFASGVSNSTETRESEYQREIDLLMSQDKVRHIVYFSSLLVFYSDTRYAQHKRYVEGLIKENFEHYTIMRLGNIAWGKNPNILINFIRNKVKNNESFEIKNVYRHPLEKEEFQYWINLIPDWNCEMSITGKLMKVEDIVKKYGNT